MASRLADVLFWVAALAILVTQWLILRSTARGMRVGAARGHAVREWSFAIGPAVVLLVLLAFTYRAMHPEQVQAEMVTPATPRA